MRMARAVLAILFSVVLAAALMGCYPYSRYEVGYGYYGYPPPWEVRGPYVRHYYYYYPDVRIYYSPHRHVYYYRHDNEWHSAKRLPHDHRLRGGRVKLRMRDKEPYKWHGEVEKRYPPRREGRREAPRREAPRREGGRGR